MLTGMFLILLTFGSYVVRSCLDESSGHGREVVE